MRYPTLTGEPAPEHTAMHWYDDLIKEHQDLLEAKEKEYADLSKKLEDCQFKIHAFQKLLERLRR